GIAREFRSGTRLPLSLPPPGGTARRSGGGANSRLDSTNRAARDCRGAEPRRGGSRGWIAGAARAGGRGADSRASRSGGALARGGVGDEPRPGGTARIARRIGRARRAGYAEPLRAFGRRAG